MSVTIAPTVDAAWFYVTDHARQRAVERLGFTPTDWDWRTAALAILGALAGDAPEALLLRRHPHGTELWMVKIATHPAWVVWSPERAMIVTVLPPQRCGQRA